MADLPESIAANLAFSVPTPNAAPTQPLSLGDRMAAQKEWLLPLLVNETPTVFAEQPPTPEQALFAHIRGLSGSDLLAFLGGRPDEETARLLGASPDSVGDAIGVAAELLDKKQQAAILQAEAQAAAAAPDPDKTTAISSDLARDVAQGRILYGPGSPAKRLAISAPVGRAAVPPPLDRSVAPWLARSVEPAPEAEDVPAGFFALGRPAPRHEAPGFLASLFRRLRLY